MRGEHFKGFSKQNYTMGSSPHARGAPGEHIRDLVRNGIIPACAGSTGGASRLGKWFWDHPRMRGEHLTRTSSLLSIGGSSPHARGAQNLAAFFLRKSGIIPACAGSTSRRIRFASTARDHPRMRGEHKFAWIKSHRLEGSSPHARGAHFATSASGRHSRLIHSLFASSDHPSGLSSDYIFARRDTCWHCSNPWKAHRQVSRHQCRSVGG